MNRYEETQSTMPWLDLDASVTCLFDLYMARLDPFERYLFSTIELSEVMFIIADVLLIFKTLF